MKNWKYLELIGKLFRMSTYILHSNRANNTTEQGWTSWVGRTGPPEALNKVTVDPPMGPMLPEEIEALDQALLQWRNNGDVDVIYLWTQGLAYVWVMYGNQF
jgi:hypothetical protein